MKILLIMALMFTQSFAQQKGSFADTRDKKTYKTVKIGKQTWMAENLNFKMDKSACYENKDANCKKYGQLYDWETANKACPSGWHLPADEEWSTLMNAVSKPSDEYGEQLVERLFAPKGESGFAALNGGYGGLRYFTNDDGESHLKSGFYSIGNMGVFWSATVGTVNRSYLDADSENFSIEEGGFSLIGFVYVNSTYKMYSDPDNNISDTPYLFSVRCVKD
jgi:uncharacterized protein (TIGR02145 family)